MRPHVAFGNVEELAVDLRAAALFEEQRSDAGLVALEGQLGQLHHRIGQLREFRSRAPGLLGALHAVHVDREVGILTQLADLLAVVRIDGHNRLFEVANGGGVKVEMVFIALRQLARQASDFTDDAVEHALAFSLQQGQRFRRAASGSLHAPVAEQIGEHAIGVDLGFQPLPVATVDAAGIARFFAANPGPDAQVQALVPRRHALAESLVDRVRSIAGEAEFRARIVWAVGAVAPLPVVDALEHHQVVFDLRERL